MNIQIGTDLHVGDKRDVEVGGQAADAVVGLLTDLRTKAKALSKPPTAVETHKAKALP